MKELETVRKILLSFLFLTILACLTLAIQSVSLTPPSVDAGVRNQTLNFTVDAGSENITQVNITIPSSFGYFVVGTNGTTTDFAFQNYSNVLVWTNSTSEGFNETRYFWFNVNILKTASGIFNFSVKTLNITGGINSTNVSIFVERTVWSSPLEEFYVKPPEIFLNWTNKYEQNLTLVVNASLAYSTRLNINNLTTGISGNYSQRNSYTDQKYWGNSPGEACFIENYPEYDNPLLLKNASGAYVNSTLLMSAGSRTNFTLIHNLTCPPGKYWGYVTIRNVTNYAENASIEVTIDVPISAANQLNLTTGSAQVKGKLEAYAKTYHHYYFNTSSIENATGVTIYLSPPLNFFLLDELGNLKARSYSSSQSMLSYNYLPNEWWEIRIYENLSSSTSYTANLYFTTLNATNTSNPNQQFSEIDLNKMGVGETKRINITLKNEGSLTFANVKQNVSVYRVETKQANQPANFSFLVPSFATKVRVAINWTGASNYQLKLFKPDGSFVNSSLDNLQANLTGVMQEEFVETTSISQGFWRVEVLNQTNVSFDPYTVTMKFWVDESEWLRSNYTTWNFTQRGTSNATQNYYVNLTIPATASAGIYEVELLYSGTPPAILKILMRVNVTTPTLVVNNSLQEATIRIKDNIGFNRTGNDVIQLTIPINNTGNVNLTVDSTLNSTFLNLSTNFIEFNYSVPPQNITPGSSANLLLNISIDTTKTQDATGIYKGWIWLNSSASHPYSYFNLSIEVNLTDELKLKVLGIESLDGNSWIENVTRAENITIKAEVFYANGTEIAPDILKWNNFTVHLIEGNVSYRVPKSGSLQVWNDTVGGDDVWDGVQGLYDPNVTIPANLPGGQYKVIVRANHSRLKYSYYGSASFFPLVVNNTGLYMELVSRPSSLANGTSGTVNVSIKNFGPLKADDAGIKLTAGGLIESVTFLGTSCSPATGGQQTVFDLSGFNSKGCWVAWTIKAGQTAGTTTVTINGSSTWFNSLSFSLTVTKPVEEEGEVVAEGVVEEKIADFTFVEAPSIVYVKQNSTNSTQIKIKNTGNVDQEITLSITGIEAEWFTITPTKQTLTPNQTGSFTLQFKVGMQTGEYQGRFVASSPNKTLEKTFTLKILLTKSFVENELKLLEQNVTLLEANLTSLEEAGYNVSEAKTLIQSIKQKLNETQALLEEGKYEEAWEVFSELRTLIAQARQKLEGAEKIREKPFFEEFLEKYLLYLIVACVVGAVAFLVYLLWPTPGYKPEKRKFVWKAEGERKKFFEKILEKLKRR